MKIKDDSFWDLAREATRKVKEWPQWKQDYLKYKEEQRAVHQLEGMLQDGYGVEARRFSLKLSKKYPENKYIKKIMVLLAPPKVIKK